MAAKWIVPAVVLVLALSGCASSSNGEACAAYEAAYNKAPDTVDDVETGDAESEDLVAALKGQTTEIEAAQDLATGEVRSAIGDSANYSKLAESGEQDSFLAYYLQAEDVMDACSEAGSAISLNR